MHKIKQLQRKKQGAPGGMPRTAQGEGAGGTEGRDRSKKSLASQCVCVCACAKLCNGVTFWLDRQIPPHRTMDLIDDPIARQQSQQVLLTQD